MEPIRLTAFEVLVVESDSEDSKIPFDSPNTSIGYLEGSNAGPVHATKISATHYRLFTCFVNVGDPIPIEFDTYGKLRQWCKGAIRRQWRVQKMLLICWGFVPISKKGDIYEQLESEWQQEEVRLGLRSAEETKNAIDRARDCNCGCGQQDGLLPIPKLIVKK